MKNETASQGTVFNIPAGVAFVDTLAKAILNGDLPKPGSTRPGKLDLADWTILLPTRRASRALMKAFVEHSNDEALLLPRIQPLGDVDEDELIFSNISWPGTKGLGTPAITSLEREFVLVSLITEWADKNKSHQLAQILTENLVHAYELARSLGKLVDRFETADVKLETINGLFEGEFAAHRYQILDFLSIMEKRLPEVLLKMNKQGLAQHRNIQMSAYKDHLKAGRASGPVIAAGSTGSIPATARLLASISKLEQGAVVLPGLDTEMDENSWEALTENHPQFGMRELLGKMQIDRSDVHLLPGVAQSGQNKARNWLASELMRPSHTTDKWRDAVTKGKEKLETAVQNISIFAAKDQRAEALAIALTIRQAADGEKSAALITPDRSLARMVKAELARWGMEINDSAGEDLGQTSQAIFFKLLLDTWQDQFSPATLKSLLAHPLCRLGYARQDYDTICANFEAAVLRAATSYRTLQELENNCGRISHEADDDPYLHPLVKRINHQDWEDVRNFCHKLVYILKPFDALSVAVTKQPLNTLINAHLGIAENLCRTENGDNPLWLNEAGSSLSDLFASLLAGSELAPDMTGQEYAILLNDHIGQIVIRPAHGQFGQLAIYGLLEARLISADIIILGGLNETVWPASAEANNWLSRPQLRQAGLPLPERKIGLSAHDFVQGFCAHEVVITYATRRDGTPAVPARWVLRLQALLNAASMRDVLTRTADATLVNWVEQIDKPVCFTPIRQPAPTPELDLRPRNFSATAIEKLLKIPYRLYAEKILKLKVLPPLISNMQAAERGQLVHDGLQNFMHKHSDSMPEDAYETLIKEFDQLLANNVSDTALRVFWQPQFKRIANWFIEQEKLLAVNRKTSVQEVEGRYQFQLNNRTYEISARADRIDIDTDNNATIIDYKTGTPPALKETNQQFSPQLFIEAIIAENAGFKDIGQTSVSRLVYMKLSGGVPAGDIIEISQDVAAAIEKTQNGLISLLQAYENPQLGYVATPQGERPDQEREYDHLSRWREWAHLFDEEQAS